MVFLATESKLPLSGKVAVITGSSRGIGKAIAIHLAQHGADIVINYRESAVNAAKVVEEIQSLSRRAVAISADVSSYDSIKSLFEEAIQHFGHIDIVVSNSGVEHFSKIEDTTPQDFDHVFGVNARAQFFVAQQAYMHISHGGCIVLTSSIAAALRGLADHALYGASKAAVEAFVRNLPSDFSPKRVRVNAVAPGGVDSDMAKVNAWRYAPGGTPDMPYEESTTRIGNLGPLKRFGKPEDVARVVGFLCSPESEWVNGQVLTVSGGAGR